jgi:hypothetical protein
VNNLGDHFKFLASLGELFDARFMIPLWRRYPAHDSDSFDALALFLDGYAFARQGAKPDFNHAAVDVVKELKKQGPTLMGGSTPEKAWDMFRSYLKDEGLNYANSPLCPSGTGYNRRRTGLSQTHGVSALEFLGGMEKLGLSPNIITWAKYSIQMDQVRDYHTRLCEINGIGPKIASLFLRDVASFYGVFPSKDRNLLQPVDVWIQRISRYLLQNGLSKEEIAQWIVRQAIQSGVNPEAVNGGMWYFGSQIAGSKYRMEKALNDLAYAKALLEEHMEAIRQEALAWNQR